MSNGLKVGAVTGNTDMITFLTFCRPAKNAVVFIVSPGSIAYNKTMEKHLGGILCL